MKIDKDLEVGLLIGANRLRALEPQEVISSEEMGHMHSRQDWDGI